MNITPELYSDMSVRPTKVNSRVNVPVAFITGRCICVAGQTYFSAVESFGIGQPGPAMWIPSS